MSNDTQNVVDSRLLWHRFDFFFLILSVGATVCICCSCLLLKVTHPDSWYFSLANKNVQVVLNLFVVYCKEEPAAMFLLFTHQYKILPLIITSLAVCFTPVPVIYQVTLVCYQPK